MAFPVALLLIPAVLLLAGGRRGGGSRGAPPVGPWGDEDPPWPIYVGQRGDPELESLLADMDRTFRSYGVDLSLIDGAEVTLMRKTDGYHAIPPRDYWPRMAATIVYGFMPIRRGLGEPITITSAYRDPSYNEAVGGSENSRHMYFEGLDMVASPGMANAQADLAARIFVRDGAALRMGLGIYGAPGAAANIHIDVGSRRRTWKNADWWISQVSES